MDNMEPNCGLQYSGLLRVFAEIWDQIKTKHSKSTYILNNKIYHQLLTSQVLKHDTVNQIATSLTAL